MAESEVILEFKKCGVCGCKETMTQRAWKLLYPDDKDPPDLGIPTKMMPMTKHSAAVNISLPAVPGIALYEDYCGGCGTPRVTKVIKCTVPMAMLQQALAQAMAQQGRPKPKR